MSKPVKYEKNYFYLNQETHRFGHCRNLTEISYSAVIRASKIIV